MIQRGLTQSDGAVELDVTRGGMAPNSHQIQVTVYDNAGTVAAPVAGTLTVKLRTPGSATYESVENNVIDLTDRDNWLQNVTAVADRIEITPTGLDADARYDVVIV